MRSNRRSAILAAGLFDRFLDSIKISKPSQTFCRIHFELIWKNTDVGNGKVMVRRAYALGSSPGNSSSSWVAGGLQKVHIDFFVEDTMSGDFSIFLGEKLRANVPGSLLEWPNLFSFQHV